MAKIKFLGAAGEVTGSSYVVTTSDGKGVMVDLGMFQGGEEQREKNAASLPEVAGVSGLILTHAHLDHCGRLPLLLKNGFKGKIWATKATVDLTYLVLLDSAKIAEGGLKHGQESVLYSENEVEMLMSRFEVVDYGVQKEIEGVGTFKFWDAGHILGSASVELKLAEGKTIIFSGDLGNDPSPIVKESEEPKMGEVVVMESTYGDRNHPPRGEEKGIIARLCSEIVKNKGTLLVPAFSLERTQEILMLFDELKRKGEVSPGLSVYLDSPMGLKATAIFEKYPELFNSALAAHIKWDDPFDFPGLVIIDRIDKSKKIARDNNAKVIVAGSGMMSGGRIVHHAKNWLAHPNTIVLITGFQAKGTLGRQIKEGAKEVRIEGENIVVNARVEEIETMSAHADQGQLLEWIGKIKEVRKIFLTHGEDEAREVLKDRIDELTRAEVERPNLGEEMEI